MNRFFFFLFFSLIIGFFSTCKREYIGDYDANYIGEWHSDTLTTSDGEQKEIYFIINGENSEFGFMCQINCSACACQVLATGKALINDKHKVIIIGSGNGKNRTRLKIKTPPYQDASGQWRCVILDSGGIDIMMYKR